MKVRLKQASAGPAGVIPADSIIDVDDATGKYLIDSRQGVEVKAPFPDESFSQNNAVTVETATAHDVAETATTPNRRKPKEQPKELSEN
jgi:hypothetical protein